MIISIDKTCCGKCGGWYPVDAIANELCPFCRGSLRLKEL